MWHSVWITVRLGVGFKLASTKTHIVRVITFLKFREWRKISKLNTCKNPSCSSNLYLPFPSSLWSYTIFILPVKMSVILNKKALLSQRWPRDAPYVYLQAIHPNFVHAYGHYTMRGFWFWTNLSSGNFVYFCKTDVSAVQGHPRSFILVPLESAYATSY